VDRVPEQLRELLRRQWMHIYDEPWADGVQCGRKMLFGPTSMNVRVSSNVSVLTRSKKIVLPDLGDASQTPALLKSGAPVRVDGHFFVIDTVKFKSPRCEIILNNAYSGPTTRTGTLLGAAREFYDRNRNSSKTAQAKIVQQRILAGQVQKWDVTLLLWVLLNSAHDGGDIDQPCKGLLHDPERPEHSACNTLRQALKKLRAVRNTMTGHKSEWAVTQSEYEDTLQNVARLFDEVDRYACDLHWDQWHSSADAIRKTAHVLSAARLSETDMLRFVHALRARPRAIPFCRNERFVGRAGQLEQMQSLLMPPADNSVPNHIRSLILTGVGGVGKTATAIAYAYLNMELYSAGVIVLNAATSRTLTSSVTNVVLTHLAVDDQQAVQWRQDIENATAVGRDCGPDGHRAWWYLRRWLEAHVEEPWLLVLDNADDKAMLLRSKLWADLQSMHCSGNVVITSRAQSWSAANSGDRFITVIELNKLDLPTAQQCLLRYLGRQLESLPPPERQVLTRVAGAGVLDGLPLALEQAAAYIRNVPDCRSIDDWYAQFLSLRDNQLIMFSNTESHPDSIAQAQAPLTAAVLLRHLGINDPTLQSVLQQLGIDNLAARDEFDRRTRLQDSGIADPKRLRAIVEAITAMSSMNQSVATTWLMNVTQLSDNARLLFDVFSLLNPDNIPGASFWSVSSAFATSSDGAQQCVEEIRAFSLIQTGHGDDTIGAIGECFMMHRLVQVFGRHEMRTVSNSCGGCNRTDRAAAVAQESLSCHLRDWSFGHVHEERQRYFQLVPHVLSLVRNVRDACVSFDDSTKAGVATAAARAANIVTEGQTQYVDGEFLFKFALTHMVLPTHTKSSVHRQLGKLYLETNRPNLAHKHIALAKSIDASLPPHQVLEIEQLNEEAMHKKLSGDYNGAINLWREVLKLLPLAFGHAAPNRATATAHNNIGSCFFDQGQFEEASKTFQLALTIHRTADGNDVDVLTTLGNLCNTELSKWLQKTLQRKSPEGGCSRGRDYFSEGVRHLLRAHGSWDTPQKDVLFYTRLNASLCATEQNYSKLGSLRRTILRMESKIDIAPYFFEVAQFLLACGQPRLARSHLEEYMRLAPHGQYAVAAQKLLGTLKFITGKTPCAEPTVGSQKRSNLGRADAQTKKASAAVSLDVMRDVHLRVLDGCRRMERPRETALQFAKKHGCDSSDYQTFFHSTSYTSSDAHAELVSKQRVSNLAPMLARHLRVDEQHPGRVLWLEVAESWYIMIGATTIAYDAIGDWVYISLYNYFPPGSQCADCDHRLPVGSVFGIKEPYFKVNKAGYRMIREDVAANVVRPEPGTWCGVQHVGILSLESSVNLRGLTRRSEWNGHAAVILRTAKHSSGGRHPTREVDEVYVAKKPDTGITFKVHRTNLQQIVTGCKFIGTQVAGGKLNGLSCTVVGVSKGGEGYIVQPVTRSVVRLLGDRRHFPRECILLPVGTAVVLTGLRRAV